jgi:crotonobetainyl-CoA:carnitine CoA-transferase CaiB-like acyl-CoA transferase
MPPQDSRPLEGLLVVDLTRVLAGPYCTRLLSDLGARVIKIERPVEGDEMRRNPHQIEAGREDQSTYFARVNAGKESVAVDLGRAEGREVVLDLVRHADVFIENFAPGVAGRLGLDYAAVRGAKADIVYCSISGFGQTGPWRERPAFAHIINAASGLMALEQGDEAAPRASNLQAADVLAAAHAMGAIMAALWRRARTGQGAHVDVSMLEALVGADSVTFASVLNGGEEHGNPRPGMIVHKVGGRYMAMQIVGAPRLWERLLGLMKQPELGRDTRFSSSLTRRRNWRELRSIITGWLDGFATADEALAVLTAARIPCAPVLRPAEVIVQEHLAVRGFFPVVPHPARTDLRVTASPYHLDGKPTHPRGPAPYRVGEHTRRVLRDLLGYKDDRVAELIATGVVEGPA